MVLFKNSKMEKVSVILSFYNNEKTILKSVKSVINQSYKNFELILIDDGSTDKSYALIKKNIKNNKIKIFRNKKNKGLAYSLNKGIKKSKSRLIFRMDADDICKRNRIYKQMMFLSKNPQIDLLGTNAIYFDDSGIYDKSNLKLTNDDIKDNLLFKNEFIHSSVVFKKNFFLANNGYDEKLKRGQDHDLWIRGKKFKYANMGDYLIYHYKTKKPKNIKTYYYMFFITSKYLFKNKRVFSILFFFIFIISIYLKHYLIYIIHKLKSNNND